MRTATGHYSLPEVRTQIEETLASLIYAAGDHIIDCDIKVGRNKPVFVGGNHKYARFLPIRGYVQVRGRGSTDLNLALQLTHLNIRGKPLEYAIRRLFRERIEPLLAPEIP